MRVLILAFDFPPFVSVGGLRPYSWFRHFSEFGIEPVVVTRQWVMRRGDYLDYVSPGFSDELVREETAHGLVLRTPYLPNLSNRMLLRFGENKCRTPRRLVTAFYEVAQFFLPIGPRIGLYKAARDYLRAHRVDVILATGEPFVLFKYAAKLSKEFGTPWVADYRDAWSKDSRRGASIIGKLNSYLEPRILSSAHSFTTVSSFVAQHILELLPGKSYEIVLNGFDEESIARASLIEADSREFVLGFAGTIYPWHPLESFLDVCAQLLTAGKLARLKLAFYGVGGVERLEKALAARPILSRHFEVFPRLDPDELCQRLAKSSLFLLFNDYSVLGTKIFTYLGLRRRILLCFANDPQGLELKERHFALPDLKSESSSLQAELIQATSSGVVVGDASELGGVLLALYADFESGKGIRCNSFGFEGYSRRLQAAKLARWLFQVAGCDD